ncbi:hypothetical protein N7530_007032 [Penicillium desertorum]|uniref:Uncharacterized protein n=1 Tax=Penicillium desertorum TaxID=1303715 RepID=A0A9X0BMP7_9EURO|nr:hypothetical protein N7530_007032 [Penicillium desertorum]
MLANPAVPATEQQPKRRRSVGLFFTVQLAVKAMLKNQSTSDDFGPKGSVILIESIATESGVESQGLTAYSASKGAANGLLRGLAVELAPKGIRVNMISPRAHYHRHVGQSIHESSGVGYDHAECCSHGTDGRSQGSKGRSHLFPVGCVTVYHWKQPSHQRRAPCWKIVREQCV